MIVMLERTEKGRLNTPRNYVPSVRVVEMPQQLVSEVARLHAEAFAGYMSTRLGTTYVKMFIAWFQRTESAIALVAIDENNKVVGYVVGRPVDDQRSMNRDLFWTVVSQLIRRPWLFFDTQLLKILAYRLRILAGFFSAADAEPKLPAPTMSLVGIGTLPSMRGKKIGFNLLQAFEARARVLQMRSLRLSVYPENSAARRLYDSCGWKPFVRPLKEKESMYYFRDMTEG